MDTGQQDDLDKIGDHTKFPFIQNITFWSIDLQVPLLSLVQRILPARKTQGWPQIHKSFILK